MLISLINQIINILVMETNNKSKACLLEMMGRVNPSFRNENIKYPTIGAKSLMEGIKLNGFTINKANDATAITQYIGDDLKEEISYEFDKKGGIIVFSVNVNAIKSSINKIINYVKNKIETAKNVLFKDKKINSIISDFDDVQGVTIGNFVKGRYKADDGSLYDETSLSIEIIGISTHVLNSIAEQIAKEFTQETVLVKNYEDNKIYLVK